MTEETNNAEQILKDGISPSCPQRKRDIIHFTGERPTAINLEHVTTMYLEEKRITFEFYTKSQFVDFLDEAAAQSIFQSLMKLWAGE